MKDKIIQILEELWQGDIDIATAASRIEGLNQWVSVEDRLPEHQGYDYLVYDRDFGAQMVMVFESGRFEPFDEDSSWKHEDVAYWRELPEPPKK